MQVAALVNEMQYGPNETARRPASGGQQDAPDYVSDAKPG